MSYISALRKDDQVIVWSRNNDGERETVVYPAPWYFYIEDAKGKYETIYGDRVSKLEFETGREYFQAKQELENKGKRLFESDIPAEQRVLSNAYYNVPAPKLHVTFYDIEVDYDPDVGFSSVEDPYAPINSISLFHQHQNRLVVIAVPPETWTLSEDITKRAINDVVPLSTDFKFDLHLVADETELLAVFLKEIEDTDLLCGWNSDFFDTPYVGKRLQLKFGKTGLRKLSFPGANEPVFKEIELTSGQQATTLDIFGRINADYMRLYRKYEPGERYSYALAAIEEEVELGLPKLEYEGTLAALYKEDFAFFLRYNIRDCEILHGFERKLGYVELSNQMYHLSTGQYTHVQGTLKLAEQAIINYCHHVLKKVVNNAKLPDIDRQIQGAFVLDPKIGMHEWFGSIDITSLYPSSIRSINISPETLRGQFQQFEKAAEEIAKGSAAALTFVFEDTKEEKVQLASEWKEWLIERKWAISGYGTVFDQTNEGIIPAILSGWFSKRKEYQALKKNAEKNGEHEMVGFYDRLQYVYKIKLNSLYGALSNLYFRFYDLRMGESTTGTGRMILRHQCSKVNELLTGEYDYLGEAVIYGDTDSTYFKTFADDHKSAVKIADAVAASVNSDYQRFMQQTFLCTPGFDNIIKAGREIVSDRGIFVEKKRYILHIIDLEGKTVDKMKVMGLDTKKTTIPKHVSTTLNGFIESLLKGKPWETLSQEIVDYKKQLQSSTNIMLVGLPKGISDADGYTKRWKADSSTRLPGHVAAAIHYNETLDRFNDKSSLRIKSGMKIKVFYLTGKHGQFKSIALPTDIEVIPSWFTENFQIDYDAHIERLVDKPLQNILKAIGKTTPTENSILFESVFEY